MGVSLPAKITNARPLERYRKTSWGYSKKPLVLYSAVPFILFVGGADRRRKLQDLVTAFNHLRAEGLKLKLVLAGDSMQGPRNIATEEIQSALVSSSYRSDIIFMGFIDNYTRDWLYKHALVFAFPSRYEGFGLPVLEAMIHGCPVISYNNEATKEVAHYEPLYVNDANEIAESVRALMALNKKQLSEVHSRNIEHAKTFSWQKTSKQMLAILDDLI